MFLPPVLLERLGGLEVIARTVVRGFVAGAHPSRLRGAGEDFSRHRAYQQGDDLRHLDWRVYGRTDRLYVREFRQTSDLKAFVVVDASRSMDFGGEGEVGKFRYGLYCAAALAYLMLKSGDAVGLAAFGAGPRLLLTPRARPGHLHQLLLELERLRPAGDGGPEALLERVGEALRFGGRIVLISDLLRPDDGAELVRTLGRLRARGDELVVLRIASPLELGERPLAPALFYDPEVPADMTPAAPAGDTGYRDRVAGYYGALARELRDRGVEYVPLTTAVPVESALAGWLRARAS